MSDFETMPVGTMAEVSAMRLMANELIELVDKNADREALVSKIEEIRKFYNWHVEQYPVTV